MYKLLYNINIFEGEKNMDKLKKFYKNNRIYCILMIVSAICLLILFISVLVYFIGQTRTSVYGHRLDEVKDYPVESELNNLKSALEGNTNVMSVSTDIRGKIVYVVLEVNKDMTNEDIQNMCSDSLTKLTDEQKGFYDVQYIVKREGLNPYLGSKSAHQTIIAWANFSYDEEEETQEGE